MATGTLISVDEYLNTSYHPDCDYVDGEVLERNLGEREHSDTQSEIVTWLRTKYPHVRRMFLVEQRVQVRRDRFRVPDICVLAPDSPRESIIRTAPVLCIEVLSKDDRMSSYLGRLEDYFQMGVPICWVIDPLTRRAFVATPGHMDEAMDGILRAGEIEMPLAEVLEP